jgi:hypothetical protein
MDADAENKLGSSPSGVFMEGHGNNWDRKVDKAIRLTAEK